ncbi:MAG: hypothetical protein JXA30_10570 [Deltaproteobacteria bacterium]|nr:hypothetical protein [Deltaproteobacteria bacterium]
MGKFRLGVVILAILIATGCASDNKDKDAAVDAATPEDDAASSEGASGAGGSKISDSAVAGDAGDSTSGGNGGGGTTSGGTSGGSGWGEFDSGLVEVLEGGVAIPYDGGVYVCYKLLCNEKNLACADCEDNDGDGLVDSMDPECLGPCDNTEGPALIPDVGGDTGEQCKPRDCFFDFGNGPGDDDCRWAYYCDPLAPKPGCPYDESAIPSTDCPDGQSQKCLDMCLAITPNGCDCFGCCTFPELAGQGEDGQDKYVWIGSDDEPVCTLANVEDEEACPPCTPEGSCLNTCGRCEICVGKTTIPDDCFTNTVETDGGVIENPDGSVVDVDGGPVPDGATGQDSGQPPPPTRCAPDVQPCGLPGDEPCPPAQYCVTGCCVPVLF